MNALCICLCLEPASAAENLDCEREYQDLHKPAGKFLYEHPEFEMSFSFSGGELHFFRRRHPEFLELLQRLSERKQIETLGGGFYNPVFPLLYSKDRTDQVELLSAELRQSLGKRPRGMTLCASCWDSSLVTNFQTCGMEFVMLDSSLVPPAKQALLPLIMSDRGKSIAIVPLYPQLKPRADSDAAEWLSSLFSFAKRNARPGAWDALADERILAVPLAHDEFKELLRASFFETLAEAVSSENSGGAVRLSLPSARLKASAARVPAFITAGMSADVAQWARTAYAQVPKGDGFPTTVYDFLQTYPQSQALCNRMLYVSMLINGFHGDKARKKAAREKLWEAQGGDAFICTSSGSLVSAAYRQAAYKNLSEAERIVRSAGGFKESISRFDYDGDGIDEYMFRMNAYTCCVTGKGGAIGEFDAMQGGGNYADSLSRVENFDGCADGYARGLFVDSIFDGAAADDYAQGRPARGVFPNLRYGELRFSPRRSELQLSAEAEFGAKKQKIRLRKKYLANSNGVIVQYILKNESGEPLSANFAVESNIAPVNFKADGFAPLLVEAVAAGEKRALDAAKFSAERVSEVSAVQISDAENALAFVFEPNEAADLIFMPIEFRRPEYKGGRTVPAAVTLSLALLWPIKLDPGMEVEKAVNLSVISARRRAQKKTRGPKLDDGDEARVKNA